MQVYFANIAEAMEHIKAGKLLAVTGAVRTPALPDVPTMGDFVPGYESLGWLGVVAPRDTPAAIIDTLNQAINAGLAIPESSGPLSIGVKMSLQARLPSSDDS